MDTPTNSEYEAPPKTPPDLGASGGKSEETTTAPQDPKADPGRSLFDVSLSSLGTLEPIIKAVTIAAITSYAAGFLIVVINEGRLGFLDSSLLKPRAMIVGVIALFLIVLPISFTRGVVILPRNEEKEADNQTLARLALSLTDFLAACGAAWLVASFVFASPITDSFVSAHNGQTGFNRIPFGEWSLIVALISINGLLFSPKDRRAYQKAPAFWVGYSVLWVAVFAFAAWTLRATDSAIYLVWALFTSTIFHGFARDWRRGVIRSFKLPAAFFWSLILLSSYATFLFPKIKSNWGGGAPIPAMLTTASTPGSALGVVLQVDLIEATDAGYYVRPNGQRNVVFLPKSSVQAIEFTTEIGK